MKGGYLEFVKYICSRKFYGDEGFSGVGKGGRREERWLELGSSRSR